MLVITTLLFSIILWIQMSMPVKIDESFTIEDVDYEIKSIRQRINELETNGGTDVEKAQQWGILAIFLQVKDVRYHTHGGHSMKIEALAAFHKALDYIKNEPDPRLLKLHVSLNHRMGMLLKMMGRGAESIEAHRFVFENAVHTYDQSLGYFHAAEAMSMIGDLHDAAIHYRLALQSRPDHLMVYYSLVRCLKESNEYSKSDWKNLLKEMIKQFEKYKDFKGNVEYDKEAFTYMSTTSDTEIYWAIFEVADKLGEYDEAWKYLKEAHVKEKAKHIPYNETKSLVKTETIRAVFVNGFWPTPPLGLDTMLPVFIVGMMRSGSTLTETMLDAHKDVWGMGEESIFGPSMQSLQDQLIQIMSRSNHKEPLQQALHNHGQKIVDQMQAVAEKALKSQSQTGAVKRVVDKMLFNYRNIGLIHLVYPNAVIIHTIRDPLDTVLSCYKHKFGDQEVDWTLDPADLVAEYVQYLWVMDHFRKVLPGRVHDVRYEALVKDPEGVIRGVIDRLKLDWDPSVLEFYKSNRTVQTISMSQVRHNVYTKSVGAWRRYAKHMKPFISAFNKHIPQLKAMGALPYPRDMNWGFDPNFDYGLGERNGKGLSSETCGSDASGGAGSCPDSEIGEEKGKGKKKKVSDGKGKGKSIKASRKAIKKKKGKDRGAGKLKKSKSEKKQEDGEGGRASKRKSKSQSVRATRERKPSQPKISDIQKRFEALVKAVPVDAKRLDKELGQLLRGLDGVAERSLIKRTMAASQHSSGNNVVDELVAIGYVLVNTNRFKEATDMFQKLLRLKPDVVGAYPAYGTALAMSNQLEESLVVFDRMIETLPNAYEAYERRAEILAALRRSDEALRDLNYIIDSEISDTNLLLTVYFKRGKIYLQREHYRGAYADFQAALAKLPAGDRSTRPTIMHMIGKSERELGLTEKSIQTQLEAIRADPNSKEFYLELAIAYLERSQWKEALVPLAQAIRLEPRYKLAYGYRGLMYHNLGKPNEALPDLQRAIDFDPNEPSGMLLKAACLYSLGRFAEASATYDRMLELAPSHDCFFMREIAFFYYVKLDEDVWSWNIDNDMDKKVKEGWSRHLQYTEMFPVGHVTDLSVKARKMMKSAGGDITIKMDAKIKEILELTEPIAKWIQLEHPGFMPNERQHRQYAMSVVQMAQLLREHTRLLKKGEEGLLVPDKASSSLKWFGFKRSAARDGYHVFGWRDMFDVAVRWRQVSEPLDTVWWNDRLEIKAAYNELGLKTHIQHGWTKTVRYGSYLEMGLNLTKTLLISRNARPSYEEEAIRDARTLEELFVASGNKSFYVTTSCESLAQPGEHWEGTQVTLAVSKAPEGYDYYINSLVHPTRDNQYATDMDHSFRAFIRSLGEVLDGKGPPASNEAFTHALEIFYYWVIYAPLVRGTSATGYAALIACVVAMGEQMISPVPKGKQLDWEAIFRLTPSEFVYTIRGWLSERGPTNIPKKWLDSEAGYSLTREVFRSVRNMMAAIGKLE